jgi:peptide/nickel transport system substrate-binding protein
MRFRKATALLVAAALTLLAGSSSNAADLRVGVGSEVASLDPHYYNLNPNVEIDDHIYDYLVSFDAKGGLVPGLATQWKAVDDTTWEFTLRKCVKFHGGSPFTAADVIFAFDRAKKPTDAHPQS